MSQTAERPGETILPRPVIVLIAWLVAVAAALWWVWPPWHLDGELVGAAALAALALIAQLTPIDLYGAGRVSTSGILILAAGMLQGVPGALLLATLVALLQWAVSRGPLHRLLFDLGMLNAAGAAGALVYLGSSPLVSTEVSPWIAPIGVVAGLGFYLVNIGLLTLVMGLSEHRRLLAVWEERFRWLWLHYLVYGLLAAFIVLAYRAIGILGLAVFFVPPTMLRYVMRQYVAQTEQSVVKLTAANQELVQAHDETSRALAQLQRNYEATLLTLSAALDSRDAETEGHSRRVVEYAKLIAAVLRLADEQVADLVSGGLLHDVGKIGVPDRILRKPGPLDRAEWELMRAHCEIGYRMLAHLQFLAKALPVVRHHHERYDGSGYPDGLAGAQIPLLARVFAVADTFDAMTSDRPYRAACSPSTALEEVRRCSGTQFDPLVVDAFCRVPLAELERVAGSRAPQPETGTREVAMGSEARQSPRHMAVLGADA